MASKPRKRKRRAITGGFMADIYLTELQAGLVKAKRAGDNSIYLRAVNSVASNRNVKRETAVWLARQMGLPLGASVTRKAAMHSIRYLNTFDNALMPKHGPSTAKFRQAKKAAKARKKKPLLSSQRAISTAAASLNATADPAVAVAALERLTARAAREALKIAYSMPKLPKSKSAAIARVKTMTARRAANRAKRG